MSAARAPYSAEERVENIDVLLFAIFCVISGGSSRAGDPGNENTIGNLCSMARRELSNLQAGLTAGKAMNLDCGL